MNDRFSQDQDRATSSATAAASNYGTAGSRCSQQEESEAPGSAAVSEFMENVRQCIRDVQLLLQVQWDGIKLSVRRVLMLVGLCLMAALTATAALVVAVAMLCHALADLIGSSLGNRPWLGDLIVSVVVIAGISLGISGFWKNFHRSSLRRTVEKYDHDSRTGQN